MNREGGAPGLLFGEKYRAPLLDIRALHQFTVHVLLCLITSLWKIQGISECAGIWSQYFTVPWCRYPVAK